MPAQIINGPPIPHLRSLIDWSIFCLYGHSIHQMRKSRIRCGHLQGFKLVIATPLCYLFSPDFRPTITVPDRHAIAA
ncbi:putative ribosome biogenesis protein C8F11.04 [Fusarium oxysporum f. sp. albedinis]|nr:putative ribosome biogenesis protein C8F11.04 [Fusarium oxysporum f. sp. albedinis]